MCLCVILSVLQRYLGVRAPKPGSQSSGGRMLQEADTTTAQPKVDV